MRIVVPTDFSPASKVAFDYAAKLALKYKAELTLLYAVINEPPRAKTKTSEGKKFLQEMLAGEEIDFMAMKKEILTGKKRKLKVKHFSVEGTSLAGVINKFTRKNKTDLIIIGTKGAGGLKKILFGSNAADVISNCRIPVLTVPENALFSSIRRLVFPVKNITGKPKISDIISLAKLFNASLHMVHFPDSDNEEIQLKKSAEKLKETLRLKFRYPKIFVGPKKGNNIADGIMIYALEKKADLIAMITTDHTFFYRISGKSVSRKLAFETKIPLLTIKI